MATLLPKDADNETIQALRPAPGKAQTISVTATSARNGTAFAADTRVVELWATTDMFVRLGGGSVTAAATDHFLPADDRRIYSLGSDKGEKATHIAAIRATADGTLYVSEME